MHPVRKDASPRLNQVCEPLIPQPLMAHFLKLFLIYAKGIMVRNCP